MVFKFKKQLDLLYLCYILAFPSVFGWDKLSKDNKK